MQLPDYVGMADCEPAGPEWVYVASNTYKLRVRGGWLYRYTPSMDGSTIVFVPDVSDDGFLAETKHELRGN